jgi:hypothetical protein
VASISASASVLPLTLAVENNFSEVTREQVARNTVSGLLGAVAPDDLNLFTTQTI